MTTNRFDAVAGELLALTGASVPSGSFRQFLGSGGGEKWRGGLSRSGAIGMVDHATTRRNSRLAMQESVQARAVVERNADTIADGGLRLELAPVVSVLGISSEYAAAWAKDTAARFDLWARDKNQHRAGTINWYQSQPLWQLFRHRDNDQFVRLFYERDPSLQNPLQFDFIDPDQVRGDALTTTYGFNGGGDDGIIRDEKGREKQYKVYVRKSDNTGYDEVVLDRVLKGGRIGVLHGFKPEYAGQGRGYARLHHAIQDLENITDFSASTIKKAINQSSIVAFVEPSKTEDAVNPFTDILTNAGAGPAAQLFGSNPQPVPGVPVDPDARAGLETCYRVPEATMDTPGGMFIANLTKGSSIKFPANTAPGDSYDKFVDAFFAYIAASMSIPIEVVLMKFGQNYSASRGTLLLFWRVVCIERAEMAADYLNPVVEMWLSEEIAAGRITAPGWTDPRMRAAWLNCIWIGSGSPDIDPVKSAKARRENIEVGISNAELEAQNFNGTSAADNIAKNNAAYANYKPLPWNESGNPPPGTPVPGSAPVGRVAAALLEEIRVMVREEVEDANA